GGVGAARGLGRPLLGLLHRLPGPLELGPLALELALGGRQPALGLLAVLRPLPAVAALLLLLLLGAGRLALRRGRRRRADQPDRGGALLASEAPRLDRLGDLGVAHRRLQRLPHPGQDLLPDAVLAPDCLGGPQQRVDGALLAAGPPAEAKNGG